MELRFLLFCILLRPLLRLGRRILRSIPGVLCLWVLNRISGFTGLEVPFNAVTVFLTGIGGLPGLFLVALLEIL